MLLDDHDYLEISRKKFVFSLFILRTKERIFSRFFNDTKKAAEISRHSKQFGSYPSAIVNRG